MVTPDSTQVIDPEFGFYGPMSFDIGAFLGNLAYYSHNGHVDQANDRKVITNLLACYFCTIYTPIVVWLLWLLDSPFLWVCGVKSSWINSVLRS